MSEENPYAPPDSELVPSSPKGTGYSRYGEMRDTLGWGRWVQALLWLQAFVYLLFSVADFYAGLKATNSIDIFWKDDGVTKTSFLIAYENAVKLLWGPNLLTVFFFCVWTNKTMKNTWAMSDDSNQPSISPGWAAGYYFMPITMWWKPLVAMRQIWRITFGENGSILFWWWGFWTSSAIMDVISALLQKRLDTFEEMAFANFFASVGGLFTVVAAILILLIVGRITHKQMESMRGR